MVTKESYTLYINRTVEHIHRVHKNMAYLVTECRDFSFSHMGSLFDLGNNEQCRELMHQVFKHDRSKFSSKQFIPYIHLTEYYHQRKMLGNSEYEYPTKKIREFVEDAVNDHYFVENHHPESLYDTRWQVGIGDEKEGLKDYHVAKFWNKEEALILVNALNSET